MDSLHCTQFPPCLAGRTRDLRVRHEDPSELLPRRLLLPPGHLLRPLQLLPRQLLGDLQLLLKCKPTVTTVAK